MWTNSVVDAHSILFLKQLINFEVFYTYIEIEEIAFLVLWSLTECI